MSYLWLSAAHKLMPDISSEPGVFCLSPSDAKWFEMGSAARPNDCTLHCEQINNALERGSQGLRSGHKVKSFWERTFSQTHCRFEVFSLEDGIIGGTKVTAPP
jgi:hypothetical protein